MSRNGSGMFDEGGFTLVELLVVIGLISVLGVAAMNVIISTQRSAQFQNDMRTVMDDGRITLDRMRNELRAAKRILDADPIDEVTGEGGTWIRFWLDESQDDQLVASEVICWAVDEIDAQPGRFEVVRWTHGEDDCSDPGSDARVIARTLVERHGVFTPDPVPEPDDPHAPRTRQVRVSMELDVRTERGPRSLTVQTTVRLRNVR